MTATPFIIEADSAQAFIAECAPVIIDLSRAQSYATAHIPGAVNLDYAHLVHGHAPAPGKLPEQPRLQALVDSLGIAKDRAILIYDDEGSSKSSRLVWVLDCLSYSGYKIINGGLQSWADAGHALDDTAVAFDSKPQAPVQINPQAIATKQAVLEAIDAPDTVILDARTAEEYAGQRGGARFGHIPSAVNLNWLNTIDIEDNLRIRPPDQLLAMYAQIGVTPDKNIIAHCQTHHRSAHTYALLKHLGFANVKGYAGSWAEWSADENLPIA